MRRDHLDDFVQSYAASDKTVRVQSERFRMFSYGDLMARDKANLDIKWIEDESLEDTGNLPAPSVLAAEIVEDLEAALTEFSEVTASLISSSEATLSPN